MKIPIAFIIAFILFSFTAGYTADTTELSVETKNGKNLIIRDVKSGNSRLLAEGDRVKIGKDTHGNPIYRYEGGKTEFFETDDITLRLGDAFGFEFRLPEIPENDEIVIKAVAHLPKPTKKGEALSDMFEGEIKYDSSFSGKVRRINQIFKKEEPEYHMTGIWQLSLYNKGNHLISHRFNIIKE